MAAQETKPGLREYPVPKKVPRKKGGVRKLVAAGARFAAAGLVAFVGYRGVQEAKKLDFNIPAIVEQTKEKIIEKGAQITAEINERTGQYDMEPPPGRQAEKLSEIPATITIADIPHIPEKDDSIPKDVLQGEAILGFDGFLEERQSWVGKSGEPMHAEISPPEASLSGYLVAKERQSDGSVLFAIELPYLNSPKDILTRNPDSSTPQLVKEQWRSANLPPAQKTRVGGAIVWIKLYEGTNPTYFPFTSAVTWGESEFEVGGCVPGGHREGHGEKPLLEYARLGDPIRARISLSLNSYLRLENFEDTLNEYVNIFRYGDNIEKVKERLQEVVNENMQNAQELVRDTGKTISFQNQIKEKRYIFTAESIGFLPKS